MDTASLLDLLDAVAQQPVLVTAVMGAAALAESALGIGAAIPGETVVAVGAGALAGTSALWLAWVVVATGAFLGDHVGYLVGRRLGAALPGSALVRKFGPQRWERASRLVERHGAVALVLGRLLPGVRTLLAVAAGGLGMSYRRYVVATGLAALLWSGVWVSGGGVLVSFLLRLDQRDVMIAVGIAVVLALGGAGLRRARSRHTGTRRQAERYAQGGADPSSSRRGAGPSAREGTRTESSYSIVSDPPLRPTVTNPCRA